MSETIENIFTEQPSTTYLVDSLGLRYLIIGVYDTPSIDSFPDIIEKKGCLFSSFNDWQNGKMSHIARVRPGCLGAAYWMCGAPPMEQSDFLDFLVNTEGLKPNYSIMQEYLDKHKPYPMTYRHLVVGPLFPPQYRYCKTITFFCNPDQLSGLLTALFHEHSPQSPPLLLPSYGAGCYQILGIFPDLDKEFAIISSTDIAMRYHLPENITSLSMTRPLFEKLTLFNDSSFLNKPFWKRLVRIRNNPPKD